jgi:hypothetical protein
VTAGTPGVRASAAPASEERGVRGADAPRPGGERGAEEEKRYDDLEDVHEALGDSARRNDQLHHVARFHHDLFADRQSPWGASDLESVADEDQSEAPWSPAKM